MLNNTVNLFFGSTDTSGTPVSLIDGPTNRKTLRASADGATQFSVAHGESNENPGYVTQRSNTRIGQTFDVPDAEKQVNPYVQLTFSYPKGAGVVASDIQKLVAKLINVLVNPDEGTSGDVLVSYDQLVGVARLVAQEP